MGEEGRDNNGRFTKSRKETFKEKQKRLEALRKEKQQNPDTQARLKYPKIFNSWRAILYTEKGKSIGYSTPEWKQFINFFNDVFPTWEEELEFHRIDNSKGHTKDNVVPACYECNCARNSNFTFEEMKALGQTIKQIKEQRKQKTCKIQNVS